jgi:hypothetical protein
MNAAVEPALDELEFAIDGGLGDMHERGRLFRSAAKEVAQFNQLNFVGIDRGKLFESEIEVEEFRTADVDPGEVVGQGDALQAAATNLGLVAAGVVDQDETHHLGGKSIEVLAIFADSLTLVEQAQVKFVDQRSCLEDVGISFATDIGGSNLAQVRINQRHQFFKCRGLTVLPLGQQHRDLALSWMQTLLRPFDFNKA